MDRVKATITIFLEGKHEAIYKYHYTVFYFLGAPIIAIDAEGITNIFKYKVEGEFGFIRSLESWVLLLVLLIKYSV